jgi:hypothetical protein
MFRDAGLAQSRAGEFADTAPFCRATVRPSRSVVARLPAAARFDLRHGDAQIRLPDAEIIAVLQKIAASV